MEIHLGGPRHYQPAMKICVDHLSKPRQHVMKPPVGGHDIPTNATGICWWIQNLEATEWNTVGDCKFLKGNGFSFCFGQRHCCRWCCLCNQRCSVRDLTTVWARLIFAHGTCYFGPKAASSTHKWWTSEVNAYATWQVCLYIYFSYVFAGTN